MSLQNILSKKNRALLRELVVTDFKLRYQGSALGYAWSLLRPLLLFLILYIVFVRFLKLGAGVPHYPIYLLLGIVMWNFFSEMTSLSLSSIVVRGDLIRKIRIPRWIIVLSSSVTALINFGLNLIVVGVFMAFNHVPIGHGVLLVPLILVQLYLFALGISLILATAFVKYRDVSYIWEVVLQAGFYITPILYPLTRITNHTFQQLIVLNPVATAIQDARYALVTRESITIHSLLPHSIYSFAPYFITVLALLAGVLYFKRNATYFAEDL